MAKLNVQVTMAESNFTPPFSMKVGEGVYDFTFLSVEECELTYQGKSKPGFCFITELDGITDETGGPVTVRMEVSAVISTPGSPQQSKLSKLLNTYCPDEITEEVYENPTLVNGILENLVQAKTKGQMVVEERVAKTSGKTYPKVSNLLKAKGAKGKKPETVDEDDIPF